MLARRQLDNKAFYIAYPCWIIGLGVFMVLSPKWFYGPSWFYFTKHGAPILPSGGMGMGICLTCLGVLQLVALWLNVPRVLAVLFFLAGFVLWLSGLILFAEGLAGHQGLMEGPAYMALGAHKFVISGILGAEHRKNR